MRHADSDKPKKFWLVQPFMLMEFVFVDAFSEALLSASVSENSDTAFTAMRWNVEAFSLSGYL